MSRRFTPTITVGGVSYPQAERTLVAAPAVLPVLAGISPSQAPIGTTITLIGNNFLAGMTVQFTGASAVAATSISFGGANVVVPAGTTTGPMTVTTSAGTSAAQAFTVGALAPSSGPAVANLQMRFTAGAVVDNSASLMSTADVGRYSGVAYQPWTDVSDVSGMSYDSNKGWHTGEPFNTSFALPTGATVIVSTAGTVANRESALQAAMDAAFNGTGPAVIYCAGPFVYGRVQTRPNTRGDGQWVYILDDRFRTGTFPKMPASDAAIASALDQIYTFTRYTANWVAALNTYGALVTQARVLPADMANAPKLEVTAYNRSCFFINPFSINKARLCGFELRMEAGYAAARPPVNDNGGVVSTYYGFITDQDGGSGPAFTAGTEVWGSDMIVDRCYLHGETGAGYPFAIRLFGQERFAIVDSYVEKIHQASVESKALQVDYHGTGFIIRNNYVAVGWGIHILFGGNDVVHAQLPRDVLIELNQFDFPPSYLAAGMKHKNNWETKGWLRACLQRNLISNYRATGLLGQSFAGPFKSSNQVGGGPQGECKHTRLRVNSWTNCDGHLALVYSDNQSIGHRLTEVAHNGMYGPAGGISADSANAHSLIQQIPGMRLWHNTMVMPTSSRSYPVAIQGGNGNKDNFQIRGNILATPPVEGGTQTWFLSSGVGAVNNTAWQSGVRINGARFDGNLVVAGTNRSGIIAGNTYVDAVADVMVNADCSLQVGSPALGAGDGGADLGCDAALVMIATAGVRSAN